VLLSSTSPLEEIIQSVDPEKILTHIRTLQDNGDPDDDLAGTRLSTSNGMTAKRRYIVDELRSYGLLVYTDGFKMEDKCEGLQNLFAHQPPFTKDISCIPRRKSYNVIAIKPGISPGPEFLIMAHYDSINTADGVMKDFTNCAFADPRQTEAIKEGCDRLIQDTASSGKAAALLAPGANDNASGVAVLLEAARVLSRVQTEATIKFIALDAEEFGLLGAKHYLFDSGTRPEDILGFINLDMVGVYNPEQAPLRLFYHRAVDQGDIFSSSLAARMETLNAHFNLQPVKLESSQNAQIAEGTVAYGSDHAAFWEAGITNGIFLTGFRSYFEIDPLYHSEDDLLTLANGSYRLSPERMATTAQLVAAAAADYSKVISFTSPAPPLKDLSLFFIAIRGWWAGMDG
jgi:hypothetical protein